LDSIDLIGKNSTATLVRVNFNQKTSNFGWGGECVLMKDKETTLGLFSSLNHRADKLLALIGDYKVLAAMDARRWNESQVSREEQLLVGEGYFGMVFWCLGCQEPGRH
jgi:hypothetical protein